MNRFFTLLLAASCLTAVGQVTYPYNPDGNADGDIAVGDLQDFLGTYGNPFSPSEIMVGDSSLTYWVEQLSQTLLNQESLISTLQLSSTNDLAFPIGYSGESINQRVKQDVPFVVPQSQVFHLTSWRGYTPLINGLRCQTPQTMPIILNSGDSLRTDDNNWSHFSGILMDAQGLVVGVNRAIDCNNPFVVPQGKNLYMTHWLSNGAEPASGELQIPIPYGIPVILNSGDTLTNGTSPQCFSSTLNGYLVDEDFFDTPLQESEEETTLTIDWEASETGSTFNVTGNVDRIVVNIPTTVPAEWAIHANPPVNGSYVHYMEFQDISDFVLSNGVSHLSWVTPSFPAAMSIDLSGITANEVVIEWDRIESKQSTYLPYLDSLYQELSFICSFSFLNHGFPLDITNLEGLGSPYFALNYDYAFSNNGANESLQINTDEGYNGQPFKRFKKLMSGHWVNEVND